MTKQNKKVKAIQANLHLTILEKDLLKIKKMKNPEKSKVFKQYSDLLLTVLKKMDLSDIKTSDDNK